MTQRIAYMEPVPPDVQEIIRSRLPDGYEIDFRPSDAAPVAFARDADFVMVATTRIDDSLLQAATQLRLVQHQGVGYDNIDLEAARSRGVPVAICPEGTSVGVAEHVILLILSIYRRLLEADASIRRGEWLQWELRPTSLELAGKTVGLVGFGRIGREVAQRLRGFDVDVLYYDPFRADVSVEEAFGVRFVSLDALLAESDIVSLHLPLSAETRGLVDAEFLAGMKQSAILINTARGGLVDQTALIDALRNGVIAAAGLDVFATEPLPPDSPIRALPNAVLTPHIAAGTADALRTKMDACFANIVAISSGREPANRIA
ncbi:MAG: 2-hydroxyacid dehydrogenase [Thermomicrobiales bacterium]|nr:2-hydroxyacid dehydrogenase [Thermomicrobiales bacterium]